MRFGKKVLIWIKCEDRHTIMRKMRRAAVPEHGLWFVFDDDLNLELMGCGPNWRT